jgi:hypothetical protein
MAIVIEGGITIGGGIGIAVDDVPVVVTFITTENNEDLITESGLNLVTENS